MTKKVKEKEPVVKKTNTITKRQAPAKSDGEVVEVEATKGATAKAGKRSKKVIEEEAAKVAKEVRKAETAEKEATKAETPKPKHTPKNMAKAHSKAYREAKAKIEPKLYDLDEAIELVTKLSKVKFDATVELHANLGIDTRQSDQMIRANVVLPKGTGKTVRVAVIADEAKAKELTAVGADRIDNEKLISEIEKGKIDFDVLIATPDKMAALGKLAKILGPKGLMPSPKAGTVATDPVKAVQEIKAGRVELKNDPSGIIHVSVGKVSFSKADLASNAKAIIAALAKAKPANVKGTYLKSLAVSATMTPSIKVDPTQAPAAAKN